MALINWPLIDQLHAASGEGRPNLLISRQGISHSWPSSSQDERFMLASGNSCSYEKMLVFGRKREG